MADYIVTGIGKTSGATVTNDSATNFMMAMGSTGGGTSTAVWQTSAAVLPNQRGIRFTVPDNEFIFAQVSDNPNTADPNPSYAIAAFVKTPAAAPTSAKYLLSIRTNSGASTGAQLQLGTNWKIRAINRTGASVGTAFTNTLLPNTTYWISLRATAGTVGTAPASTDGVIEIGYFLPDTTTPIESYVISNVDTGQTNAVFGNAGLISATPGAYSLDLSNIVVRSGGTGLILPPNGNTPPAVEIDAAISGAEPWSTVSHIASGSDQESPVTYAWTVVSTNPAGLLTTAQLTGASSASVSYEAPATLDGATITLRCTVTDSDSTSTNATVTDTILFATDRWIGYDGLQHPMRRDTVE